MPLLQAQVIFPMFTNLPRDVFVNRFHFLTTLTDREARATEIANRLRGFYNILFSSTATNRVNYVDWQQAKVKVFDLDDPIPRIPTEVNLGYTSAGTATSTVPTEVALVLSFHAAPESGVRFQRLYNRVYIGMILNSMISASAADEFPRFSGATLTAGIAALEHLDSTTTLALQWRQVSSAGGTTVDRNIVGGWVDNGPDTQRRRSVLASVRGIWTPS